LFRPLLCVVLVTVVACGSGDDDSSAEASDGSTTSASTTTTGATGATTTSTSGGGGGDVQAAITLNVDVTSDGAPVRAGTLSCGATASGTGHLADPAAAQAACDLLRNNAEAVRRLVEGPETGRMCTMQYGGPEVAKVTGQIDRTTVDATLNRVDGCAIGDWQTLQPLVGPPVT